MGTAVKKLYILAGEASGDLHGANLIHHLRSHSTSPLEIYGVGGDKMREAGVRDFFDLAHFHVTGFTSAIAKYPQYKRAAATILTSIEKARPDLVVLIDNPGFNLHMAQRIHALGIPIVYFIAPQVWAWAPKRVEKIKKWVKKVLVVFEFEKHFFEKNGVPAVWVGHPLKDIVPSFADIKRRRARIALLPGSRKGELQMLFSTFLEAAKKIGDAVPEASFFVLKAPTLPRVIYEKTIEKVGFSVEIIEEDGYRAIAESTLALACSGTVTLECAILGTPMVIANRASLLTYVITKNLITVPYLGLPNLVLDEHKFPEYLQYDATPQKIADGALKMMDAPLYYDSLLRACQEVSKRIGETGASKRAAEEVLALL